MTTAGAMRCVWMRDFAVYRKSPKFAVVTTFVKPLLYLTAFGFGLGAMIVADRACSRAFREFTFSRQETHLTSP
jgi:hypothetical protein